MAQEGAAFAVGETEDAQDAQADVASDRGLRGWRWRACPRWRRPSTARAYRGQSRRRDGLHEFREEVTQLTSARALLAVVPSGESVEIEATILAKDIGFIRACHRVTITIESIPYTRYSYLTGAVARASHDAAQVCVPQKSSLSAEIKTGKRRVISYLLSPLQQHSKEAFRER